MRPCLVVRSLTASAAEVSDPLLRGTMINELPGPTGREERD